MKAPFSVLLAAPLTGTVELPFPVAAIPLPVDVLVVAPGMVMFPVPIPSVDELAVTLKEFPANTVKPELRTTFAALKFDRVAASFARVIRTELFVSVLVRSCVYR